MKNIKYFFQFLFISSLLIFFKIIGLKFSRIVASKLFSTFGPFFRSKKIIEQNISYAFHDKDKDFEKIIIRNMWKSYGKILAEYVFMKYFRKIESEKFLEIKGQKILEKIQNIARNEKLKIITTEKDFMKIPQEFKKEINFLTIDLVIQDEKKLIELLAK